ncbi:MAG: hypothetical protein RIQ89_215 [Bacteroidota bacterium]
MIEKIQIRKATAADVPAMHELIMELALFEKCPDQVTNSPEQLLEDGFGNAPVYNALVASDETGKIVGLALYFIKYSTWRGKGLYLDDLIVTQKYRGQGIGKKLFTAYRNHAASLGAKQLHWQVLDWNTPAITFYENEGASIEAEWWDCKINLK